MSCPEIRRAGSWGCRAVAAAGKAGALALALVLSLAAAQPARAALTFSPPTALSTGGNAITPQVAMNPSGDAHAVWVEGSVIKTAYRPAGGAFGAPVTISKPDGSLNAVPK